MYGNSISLGGVAGGANYAAQANCGNGLVFFTVAYAATGQTANTLLEWQSFKSSNFLYCTGGLAGYFGVVPNSLPTAASATLYVVTITSTT